MRALVVLLFVACGSSSLVVDGGAQPDAGQPDAGQPDAGRADSGVHDGGVGQMDAGVDAGGSDAGSDAGAELDGGAALQGGDTCASAPDVTAGGTFTGTTDDPSVHDDYGPSGAGCPTGGSASGRDVAYRLSPAVTTRFEVLVTPLTSSFDPMLYVQSGCGGSGCLAGTVLNGPGQPESVSVDVPGGTTAFIVVDGELVTKGPFELRVIPR